MTDWTEIPDENLEPGAPGRSIDALALRDNPRAMAEGASLSPKFAAKTGASWALLDRQDANNTAAQLLLTQNIDASLYAVFYIDLVNLLLASNDDALSLQTSVNAGVSYDSGASDYRWGVRGHPDDGTADSVYGSTGDSRIKLWGTAGGGSGMTNDSAAGAFCGNIWMFNRAQTVHRRFVWDASGAIVTSLADARITGSGRRVSTTSVNAVRIFTELGGNIVSGFAAIYGLKATDTVGDWP